jgi:hypothetical protein
MIEWGEWSFVVDGGVDGLVEWWKLSFVVIRGYLDLFGFIRRIYKPMSSAMVVMAAMERAAN